MSSVVISGDISGSVTLDAPSVAGTTVLTLPATSGTVVTTATSSGISGSAITTGTVGVSVGGTGQTTAGAAFNALSPITTTGDLIIGNGTNSATRLAIGSNNTVLTSNGSTATWAAAGGGQLQTQIFTSPGTWTRPSSATTVKVWVAGSGGGSPNTQPGGGPWPGQGGSGGFAVAANVPVSAPVAVTVGAAGTTPGPGGQSGGNSGNTSSFGALVSATGGAGGPNSPGGIGANGTGTVSAGTAIYTGACTFGTTLGGATVFPTSKQSFAPRAGLAWSSASNVAPFYGSGGLSPGSIGEGYGGIGGVVIVEFVG